MLFKKFTNQGFTLIELLVVISIVGLLSTLALVGLSGSQQKARDAKRLDDLKKIQTAIELYYDRYDRYPPINAAYTSDEADECGAGDRWCVLENALNGTDYDPLTGGNQAGTEFLAELPRDPSGLQNTYRYYYDCDLGDSYQSYGLMAKMENSGNFSMVGTDGGYYNNTGNGNYYEIGNQHDYCKGAYSGANGNWWGGQTTVCVGGN